MKEHCSKYKCGNNGEITSWLFGKMEHKGSRTIALDHGGVFTLKIFSCSLCHTVHMEEDVSVKPLPVYET